MNEIGKLPHHQAALISLNKHGPADCNELQKRTKTQNMARIISYLQRSKLIEGIKKTKRSDPKKYKITNMGLIAIGVVDKTSKATPNTNNIFDHPCWTPSNSNPTRPGASDAYRIPSLGNRTPKHLS